MWIRMSSKYTTCIPLSIFKTSSMSCIPVGTVPSRTLLAFSQLSAYAGESEDVTSNLILYFEENGKSLWLFAILFVMGGSLSKARSLLSDVSAQKALQFKRYFHFLLFVRSLRDWWIKNPKRLQSVVLVLSELSVTKKGEGICVNFNRQD